MTDNKNNTRQQPGAGAKIIGVVFLIALIGIPSYFVIKFFGNLEDSVTEEIKSIGNDYANTELMKTRLLDSLRTKIVSELSAPDSYSEVKTTYKELTNRNFLVTHTFLFTDSNGESFSRRIVVEMDTVGNIMKTLNY